MPRSRGNSPTTDALRELVTEEIRRNTYGKRRKRAGLRLIVGIGRYVLLSVAENAAGELRFTWYEETARITEREAAEKLRDGYVLEKLWD